MNLQLPELYAKKLLTKYEENFKKLGDNLVIRITEKYRIFPQ